MVRNVATNVNSTIMTDGDPAPGTGGRLRNRLLNTLYTNANGTVAFNAQVIGGTVGAASSVWSGTAAGVLSKIVADGDTDPNTNTAFQTIGINQIIPSPINDASLVVFVATAQSRQGLYIGTAGGFPVRIVRNGDAAPGGGTFANFQVQSINQNGQVAFAATTTGGPGQNQGIFIGSPGGAVTKVAVSGDPAPGGGTFFTFPNVVSFNDSGEVAMIASMGPAGATGGAFAGSPGALQVVASNGAASPASGNFSFTGSSLDILINNEHDVVFRSALTGGSSDSAYFLRRGLGGSLQTVLMQGQPAPGTSFNFGTVQSTINSLLGEFFGLGPTGEVGIQTTVQTPNGNVFGGFRYRTDNLLEKSALRGEALPGITDGSVLGGASQGLGVGGPGHFAIWAELIGGSGDDIIYVTNSPAGFGISGQVKDVNGVGISGVSVNLSGAVTGTQTTDSSGNFSFANLVNGGNYVVTPASPTFSFSPVNQPFNNLNANGIANFVATQTVVAISGKVSDSSNVGLNNVTLGLTQNGLPAGTTSTNALGNYSFSNLAAGANYVVTPVGSFTPSSQTLNNLTANAVANFTAAPSIPPQCATVSFAGATNVLAGSNPQSVAIGDFNGDGKLDLAVANLSSANVSILLGTGTGGFGAATNFAVVNQPVSVAASDFNGDGKLDLAVANLGTANVSILLGTGTGGFGAATNFAVGVNPQSVAVGDFNGDGNFDLAVANQFPNNVSILLGTGTGSFNAATSFAVGNSPRYVATGDFNSDGKLDLAVANGSSDNVSILSGTGTGSFSAATNFAVGDSPFSLTVGDFNGDARLDLAVANQLSNNMSILLGTGTGSFSGATNFAVGNSPISVAVGDFNADSKLDLAVANQFSNNVSILTGTGAGLDVLFSHIFGASGKDITQNFPVSLVGGVDRQ